MKLAAIKKKSGTITSVSPKEALGGQPPPGSRPSVADLDYQVKYHRAFEAVVLAVPAVAILGFRHGEEALGSEGQ
jgi:hypothetical protein